MATVTRKISTQDSIYNELPENYKCYPKSRLPIPVKKKLIRQDHFTFRCKMCGLNHFDPTDAKRVCDVGYYKCSVRHSVANMQNKANRCYTAPSRYLESSKVHFKSVCENLHAMCSESFEMDYDSYEYQSEDTPIDVLSHESIMQKLNDAFEDQNLEKNLSHLESSLYFEKHCKCDRYSNKYEREPIDVLTHENIMQRLNDSGKDQNLEKNHLQSTRKLSKNLILPLQIDHDVPKKRLYSTSKSQGATPVENLKRSLSQVELKQKSRLPRWGSSTIKKFASLPTPSSEINNNKFSSSCSTTPLQSPCMEQAKRGMRLFSVLYSPKKNSKSLSSPKNSHKDEWKTSQKYLFDSKNSHKDEWKTSQKYLFDSKICNKDEWKTSQNLFEGDDKNSLTGYLYVNISNGKGFNRNSDTYVVLEMDSYGHYFKKAKTKTARGSDPHWDEEFDLEIEACTCLRLTCFNKLRLMGDDVCGKCSINLIRESLMDFKTHYLVLSLDRGQSSMNVSLSFATSMGGIKKTRSFCETGVFGVPISVVCSREKTVIPIIVISCIKEIEKRGMDEVGIYRLSGIASEIQNIKKLFNDHTQSAVLLLGETDIHAVAGILKLYFRELPQSLFTGSLYPKFVEGLSIKDPIEKELFMLDTLHELPRVNKLTALYLFDHLRRVSLLENINKMGVNNLATVFGPTVLRTPSSTSVKENESSSCNIDTFDIGALDVMSQVGVFRYFLALKNNPRACLPEDDLELWRRLDAEKANKLQGHLLQTAEEFLI